MLNRNSLERLFGKAFFLTIVSIGLLGAATAQAGKSITSVVGDLNAHTLTIVGTDLPTGDKAVTLGGVTLAVVSRTPTQIVATLPAATNPGTYPLHLQSGPSDVDVTLGNAGTPGPAGPAGAAGATGAVGPRTGGTFRADGGYRSRWAGRAARRSGTGEQELMGRLERRDRPATDQRGLPGARSDRTCRCSRRFVFYGWNLRSGRTPRDSTKVVRPCWAQPPRRLTNLRLSRCRDLRLLSRHITYG